jgi:hypothetical protein
VAISRLQPQYEKICCKKQPHPSHWYRYETILFTKNK